MDVIMILLAAGIGVFLLWFFEGIVKELAKADDNETIYVRLPRGNSSSRRNPGYSVPQLQRTAAPQSKYCAVPPSGHRVAVCREYPVRDNDMDERISTRRAS
jgi:hypothetical protein